MSQRYLVTGCAGFIASRVIDLLLQAGHEVVGADCLDDAYDLRLKRWRLEQLLQRDHFAFAQIDLSDRKAVDSLFIPSQGRPPFQAVINLAGRAGVRDSVGDPWAYFQANVGILLNLLEACRRSGVGKLVQASTSSVYGSQSVPFQEDSEASRPLSVYAASKKAAESLAHVYQHQYGMDISILRYFTVYGPASRPDMGIFRFIRHIAEEETLAVFGDGSQSRDFTYIDDIARGTLDALKPLGCEIINLGSGNSVTVLSVIEQIGTILGKRVRMERRRPHPADIPATRADIAKASQTLSWRPCVSFEEGLRRTIEWYVAHREFARSIELMDGEETSDHATQDVS